MVMAAEALEEYPHFFHVDVELFQGPIDLLLHLVKTNELPLEKVALAEVASQYLACLERMRTIDLEIAGEYLLIAATLLSIKSSLLLGEPAELVQNEAGELVDPHEELLRRLREAEVYKDGARALDSLGVLGVSVFPASPRLSEIESPPEKYRDHDPMLLGAAFRRVLENLGDAVQPVYEISLEHISIVERMMEVLKLLEGAEQALPFESLVRDITSRSELLGTFIALLELCKRQAIRVSQDRVFGSITICLANGDFSPEYSEFDEPQAIHE